MKIYPRLLEIDDGAFALEDQRDGKLDPQSRFLLSLAPSTVLTLPNPPTTGSETCSFKIKNSSADDRVLLFKIRRSEPKLLEFSPKFGIVEPGVTRHVSLQLTNPKISFARVLVKLAALKRSKLLEDFEASWQLASQKGVVKKVVDVRNLAFNGSENEEEDGFASLASEDIGDMRSPVLSPASQMEVMLEEEEEEGDDDNETSVRRKSNTTTTTATTRPRRVTDTTETDKEAESGSEKVIARPVAAPSPAPSVLSPTSQALLQDVGRDDDRDGGADLGRLLSESSSSAFTKKPPAAARSPTAKRERSSKTTLFACSRTKPVVASGHAGNQAASSSAAAGGSLTAIVIEVFGSSATDTVVAEALALRAVEKFDSRCRVAAIEVSEAPITSLSSSVSNVFGGSSDLDRMRAMMLEDHLKHLSVTSCPALRVFDASVNRFANLSSLDLSGNGIVAVEGALNLPLLQRLDVSGNRISSLEFCTELRGLKTLVAKDNNISSIRAVQVLIPLSASLSTLNLAHNPICLDLRYASTVVNILPKLKLFDSRDLVALGRSYSRNPTPTRGGKDGPPPLPQDLSALDALLEAEAEADAVNRGLEQEFERRLKRAVKKRQSGGGRFAVSLSSSSGSEDDDDEAAMAAAAKHKGQPKKRSSPSRATVSTSRPSSAPNPQLFSAFSRSLPSASRSQSPSGGRQAASASASATEAEFSEHLMGHTKANRAKRISQRQGVVSHWPGHENERPSETPRKAVAVPSAVPETKDEGEGEGAEEEEGELNESRARNRSTSAMSALTNTTRRSSSPSGRRQSGGSTLLLETRAHILRMKAYGIPRQEGEGAAAGVATAAEGDAVSLASKGAHSVRVKQRANDRTLAQREEDARFGIWHPRYRVPKRTFGYSKPFLHSNAPEANTEGIPLFDKYVKRMRDGFEKLPTRGTFPRAAKGLMAEWYPMDYTEVEAIRRQGYFHEVIGDTQKYSYRDLRSMESRTAHPHDEVSVDKRGSTVLSPRKGDRRGRNVMHQSRQYKTFEGRRDTEPADEYSDWRKWNPQHWTKYGNNDHAAEFEPGQEVEGMSGERSPRKVPTSRSSILDGSFQRHEASMSLDTSDIRVTASWPKQSQQTQQRATNQSWQGLVREQQAVQEDSQQREERQLSAYLSWLENAEGKKG